MDMKTRLASLVVVLATTGPLMSASEVDRLRALCAEQEMQIRQLEEKISHLTDTPAPARPAPSAGSPTADPKPATEDASYTVKPGDSIERIARRHDITVATLMKLNGLKPDSVIHPDQKIKVPGLTNATSNQDTPSAAKDPVTHTVADGETFYKISAKYGVSIDELIAANPSVNHKSLRVGEKIKVNPSSTSVVMAPHSLSPAPSSTTLSNPAPMEKPRASERPIRIEKEITYGQFAAKHGTTTRRLDELNGLELDPTTVLAQGSELYIPAQP